MTRGRRRRRRAPTAADPAASAAGDEEIKANGARAVSAGAEAAPRGPDRFAALDLGTNNCRLLIVAPRGRKFRVVDAFSRIVRLGEGLSKTGVLGEDAMARTLEALTICAEKIERRGVTRMRCIATQACRGAANGRDFLDRVKQETGLDFEIISTAEEARLAVEGCVELLDPASRAGLVFDIGGGSTEISWMARTADPAPQPFTVAAWLSMPIGVVSLSERWGGREISAETYDDIVAAVRDDIARFGDPAGLRATFAEGGGHLLGTSGTVTSIAGVHLALPRYRRDAVDGLWLTAGDVRNVTERLRAMSFIDRAAEPCIGEERADLVVCGCAILEALIAEWPSDRIRVADRGLREGILAGLINAPRRRRRRRRKPDSAASGQETAF